MIISSPCVVTLTWTLSDAHGKAIDELREPMEFLVGGLDLLPKVEEALLGQETGFEAELHLEPEHAFGDYDSALVCFEQRSLFPEALEPGMPPDQLYTVTEVYPAHVVLDGNHPLAGMALRLALKVCDVREATDEEVEAGTVGEPAFQIGGLDSTGNTLH